MCDRNTLWKLLRLYLTVWQHDCVIEWWLWDSITVWQYDCMTVWQYWQYDCVRVWLCDSMTVWQYNCVTVTHYITLNEKTLGRGGQVGRAGGGMGDARARQGQGRGSEQRTSDRIPEYLSAENISRAPAHITRWPVSGDGRHAMMWPDQATLGLATCWVLAVCGAECDCEGEWYQ